MTGPEHYREAERLLDLADEMARGGHDHAETMAVGNAQVHATLALAATFGRMNSGGLSLMEQEAWRHIGHEPQDGAS